MKLADFDFELPLESISQKPAKVRDQSKLMILDRKNQTIQHDVFNNLGKYLQENDTLIFNDTKVIPARLFGRKETGGKVEILLLADNKFLGKNIGKTKKIIFDHGLIGEIREDEIHFNLEYTDLLTYLGKYGQIPLPPYIKIKISENRKQITDRYQTVYAKIPGSAAAPTAGFHFSKNLIKKLRNEKIMIENVTLYVGLGTFAPIKTENIEDHQIHSEFFQITEDTRSKIQDAKKRVVAVGTTTVRTLETWANTGNLTGKTDIYIYPGYDFKVVNAMITNFHMPKSSLVLLVSAFAGREFILKSYKMAVEMGYKFGSFGDAMLII